MNVDVVETRLSILFLASVYHLIKESVELENSEHQLVVSGAAYTVETVVCAVCVRVPLLCSWKTSPKRGRERERFYELFV